MFRYNKDELSQKANDLNFIRDTLEKVLRLVDVLAYLNSNPLTRQTLALKGGTAINLIIFSLPRLSVDIDLDYSENHSREEMMEKRQQITTDIKIYMTTQGYNWSDNSKSRHSLDSLVFTYENFGGRKDNIKIEINYSLRSHIFEPTSRAFVTDIIQTRQTVYSVAPCEIFAGKINALISRAAARDLYDVYNMIRSNLFKTSEYELLRKSVVFYTAISQKDVCLDYSAKRIDSISFHKIKTDLLPVIQKGEMIVLDKMKEETKSYISNLMALSDDEKEFLQSFSKKEYKPELLFEDDEIIKRIKNHPMALWKMQHD